MLIWSNFLEVAFVCLRSRSFCKRNFKRKSLVFILTVMKLCALAVPLLHQTHQLHSKCVRFSLPSTLSLLSASVFLLLTRPKLSSPLLNLRRLSLRMLIMKMNHKTLLKLAQKIMEFSTIEAIPCTSLVTILAKERLWIWTMIPTWKLTYMLEQIQKVIT